MQKAQDIVVNYPSISTDSNYNNYVEVIHMIKIIKNIGFWLSITLCVLLFAVLSAQLFGIHRYLVVSGSMEPSLYAGDMVFVNSNVDFEDVQLGDVIIFQYEDMNIIHRVVDEAIIDGEKRLKTKGDNNKNADGYLTTEDNFSGVVVDEYVIPKIGFFIDYKNLINK